MTEARPAGYLEALSALQQGLDALPARWTLLGGAAVVALGVPRYTADIDATVLGGDQELATLIESLEPHGFMPRVDDAESFARANQVLLLVHLGSGIPVDLSLAWLPFEEEAVLSSRTVRYGSMEVPVPRPEDLVIYKLIAFRPKDLDDAERLIALHGDGMNLSRVRAVVGEVCQALEDSARLEALEGLLGETPER